MLPRPSVFPAVSRRPLATLGRLAAIAWLGVAGQALALEATAPGGDGAPPEAMRPAEARALLEAAIARSAEEATYRVDLRLRGGPGDQVEEGTIDRHGPDAMDIKLGGDAPAREARLVNGTLYERQGSGDLWRATRRPPDSEMDLFERRMLMPPRVLAEEAAKRPRIRDLGLSGEGDNGCPLRTFRLSQPSSVPAEERVERMEVTLCTDTLLLHEVSTAFTELGALTRARYRYTYLALPLLQAPEGARPARRRAASPAAAGAR